jgi:SecY interacting protein Syd
MALTEFERAFDALFARWAATQPGGARTEHDPEWASPCEMGDVDDRGLVAWRPFVRSPTADLTELEKLAGRPLPEALREFLGSRYFGRITAWCKVGDARLPVSLCSIWNAAEFERELEGCEAQLRNSRAETGRALLCVANTDDDRFFAISLDNGEVTLEDFGREPILIAASLPDFFDALIVRGVSCP